MLKLSRKTVTDKFRNFNNKDSNPGFKHCCSSLGGPGSMKNKKQ